MSASTSSKPHHLDHIFPFPCTLGGLYATRLSFVLCFDAGCVAIAEFFSFHWDFPSAQAPSILVRGIISFFFRQKEQKRGGTHFRADRLACEAPGRESCPRPHRGHR